MVCVSDLRSAPQTPPETKIQFLLTWKLNSTENLIICTFYLDFLNYSMSASKKEFELQFSLYLQIFNIHI